MDDEVFDPEELVRRETKVVQVLRALLIALLVVVGAFLSFGSYKLTSKWEEETYHSDFDAISKRFTNLFLQSVSQSMWSGYAMAVAVASSSDLVESAPNITIPMFKTLSQGAQRAAVLSKVFFAPLLQTDEERRQWEAYAQTKLDDLALTESDVCLLCGSKDLEIGAPNAVATFPVGTYVCKDVAAAAQQGLISRVECPLVVTYIRESCECRPKRVGGQNSTTKQTNSRPRSNHIYAINKQGGTSLVESPGPHFPIWQVFPDGELYSFALNDLFSDSMSRSAIEIMMRSQLPEISEISGSADFSAWNTIMSSQETHIGGLSLLFTPVFNGQDVNSQLIGSIVFDMDWSYLLGTNLPERSRGIEIVLESASGQKNTFKSDGERVNWVGEGDLHDPAFSSMVGQSTFEDYLALQTYYSQLSNADTTPRNGYRISVYSSTEFQTMYISSKPWFYASSVILIFAFTCILFVAYDSYVTQRQRKIMLAALERDEIVSSLFPAAVRGRLFGGGTAGGKRSKGKRSHLFPVAHPKAQLRKLLSHSSAAQANTTVALPRSEPIADFFPNVTVVFADISGFTAWSSEREPSQVFKLLETVYQSFDKLAKGLGVFKIETIGDCYVAAAGLPVYQPDHAVRVVKFAYQCILRMRELTHELELSLGPSTSSLSIRVGVHSGPVIAGVLRGEKSRFQLFGDTMNTTSRMQTTGEINMIQVSSVTANLLSEADKGHWIRKRDNPVAMKGKGLVETYWAEPLLSDDDDSDDDDDDKSQASREDSPISKRWGAFKFSGQSFNNVTPDDKIKRLVEWNTVLLLRHLKMIAATRSVTVRGRRLSLSSLGGGGSIGQHRRSSLSSFGSSHQQQQQQQQQRRSSMSTVNSQQQPHRSSMSTINSQQQQIRRSSMSSVHSLRRSSMSSVHSLRRSSITSGYCQQEQYFTDVPTFYHQEEQQGIRGSCCMLYTANSTTLATPLEDVSEIITMPGFSEKVAKEEVDPEPMDLGETVRDQLLDYVTTIASMYHDNPFHNFEHASHVVMSANKVVMRIIKPDMEEIQDSMANQKGRVALKRKIHESTFGISSDVLMQFAVVFSALIHDVDHRGVSNAQLVKEGVDVAQKYDNKCVAEQNSVDIAWNLLMKEKYSDLLYCICPTEEEQRRFRQLLVNAVIATDIADKQLQQKRKIRWDKAFQSGSEESLLQEFPDYNNDSKNDMDRKATIVFEYIIQASDVAHTMQHWKVYKKWNERLFEERYLSYVNGREEHDPSVGWFQGEIWFFDNYIIPLAKKLETCGVFGVSSDEYLSYALENRHEWETKGEEIVRNMVKKCSSLDNNDSTFCEEDELSFGLN